MILDSTARSYRVVLTAAKTTNNMPVVVEWEPISKMPTLTPTLVRTSTNGVTAVDILTTTDLPKRITSLTIYNKDTAAKTVQVLLLDAGDSYLIVNAELQPGETLGYSEATQWYTGGQVTSYALLNGSATETFSVANATADAHAMPKLQIESLFAPLASPTLTGTPAAPTATAGTNTTQLATTAFVTAAVAGVNIGAAIHAATNKATPVGADEAGIWDSVSGLLNRVSFTNLATYFSGLCSAGWNAATATAATTRNQLDNSTNVATTAYADRMITNIRQTVDGGPVDSSGFAAFGGATGSTTVTASGTLYLTAANGIYNLRGSITNPAWTGLSTNGMMYLYEEIAADGTCTGGAGTLAPVYQWGGTYSTTNGQFTFNIQEMTGKVGNGATAAQAYRVYVGEVTVAGGVVTAITWYALMGRYDSGWTATLPNTSTSITKTSNLGIKPGDVQLIIECTTADNGYSVGDQLHQGYMSGNISEYPVLPIFTTTNTIGYSTGVTNAAVTYPKAGGASVNLTVGSWKYKLTAERGW